LDLALDPAALLQCCAGEPHAFALDGSAAASWGGNTAFLGFSPRAVLRINAVDGRVPAGDLDPLVALERFVDTYHREAPATPCGFVVAALSYDLRSGIERLRPGRPLRPGQPLLHAAVYDWLLAYDYAGGAWELRQRPGADVDLDAIAVAVRQRAARLPERRSTSWSMGLRAEFDRAEHQEAVGRALAYIGAGDIYQVNVAQRFSAQGHTEAASLFAALQRGHPVPFGAYVDAGDFALVANSPECFLRRDGQLLTTYPIKGTRARATGAAADRQQQRELVADAKERAEHVMIVDLERNDIGRVCRTGSVTVRDLMRVESFPSLHHLVSEVAGVLRPDVGLAALLRATFPGGSISGAPKIRAMEIIDEIESCERSFYSGAIGLIGRDWARLNVAIRTAIVTPERLVYHAGGGIVADSDPRREYDEVLLKTLPLAQALAESAA